MPTGWRGFGEGAAVVGALFVFGEAFSAALFGAFGSGGFAVHGEDEFIADCDAAQGFLDPFFRVAFLLVNGACPFGGEFGVFDFFKALVADFGNPALKGFGFGGWDGLDEAQELFGVRDVGEALLAVGGGHFQTVTICNGFISFSDESFFEDAPIYLRIWTICQNREDIDDGEHPFFLAGVPSAANLFFFEEGDDGHGDRSGFDFREVADVG